ncbi:hypothetical protein QC762_307155 [Podospora pseudocomata]|uniref:Uncharacterized protein n=1 Tax=Podospora pseudocomata TaxID=2093779 RepID=A0ABR0GJN7_9PEZI|nr:hypothetical protein QC762_307155 [Podospora pseudocomata]
MFKAAVSHYKSSRPSSLVAGLGASSMEHEVGTKGPRGRSVNLRTRQYTDGIIHVPAPCFSVCDSAYLEAQRIGKDPELCEEDSVFYSSYNDCRMCIRDMSDYGMYGVAEREYLTPTFQPWLDYCESLPPVQYMTSTDMPISKPITPATIVKVPESTDKPVIDISPATSPQTPRAAPIPSTPPPNEEPIAPSTGITINSITTDVPLPSEPFSPPTPASSPGSSPTNARGTVPLSCMSAPVPRVWSHCYLTYIDQ